MKTFKTEEQMIAAKALESLKAYAADQPESIDWSVSGLKKEIIKERAFQAKKVQKQYHPYNANQHGVKVGQSFIPNFGIVSIK